MTFQPKTFSLPFIKKEQIAKDTYSFYFDTTKKQFKFLPGQYVRITVPTDTTHTLSRFFTIASSPHTREHIIFTLKKGQSDFKQIFFTLQENKNIHFFGPLGMFYFDEIDTTERVFLAGGIGLTPFYSMLLFVAEKKLSTPITLIASFSTPEEMIYYDELSAISKIQPNIKIIYTVTKDSPQWIGERGRISEALIKKYIKDIAKPKYYIVGFPEMVSDIEELLEGMGVGLNKIKVEPFTGY